MTFPSSLAEFSLAPTTATADAAMMERLRLQLRLATDAAGLGQWELDAAAGRITWDARMYDLHGIAQGATMSAESWLAVIHPDDRSSLADLHAQWREGTRQPRVEFRVTRPVDHRLIWLEAHAVVQRDEQGRLLRVYGTVADISGRKANDARLRLVDAAVSHLNDMIVITDADVLHEPGPRIVYVNEAFTRLTGYGRDEVIGRSPRMLQGPGTDRRTTWRIGEALRAGQPVRAELLNYGKLGEELWIDLDIVPVTDARGAVRNFVAIQRDVTERKRSEAALIESERHLQAIVDATPECVKLVDAQGRLQSMNAAGLAMLGVSDVRAILGRPVIELVAPEHRRTYREFSERVLAGERGNLEFEMINLRGERRWMETHAVPFQRHAQRPPLMLALTRDVTERRRAKAMYSEYAKIIESASDAIFSKDLSGTIQSWNPGARRMFGYESCEVIGHNVLMLIPPELAGEERAILERIKRGERVEHFETVRQAKSGQRIEVSLTISPIWDANRRVIGASKVMRDISERRRAERALRDSEQRFQRHDERTQLVLFEREQDRIGRELHDGLGQQLTGVAFLAKALERKLIENMPVDPQDVAWIVRLLNVAVDHVRFLSRNLSPVELDDHSLGSALEKLASDFRSIYGIDATVEMSGQVPPLSRGAVNQLFRIAQEALNNAVRHGSATALRVRILPHRGEVVLLVHDNGIGFSRARTTGREGLGQRSMRIRAQSLGGRLRIRSGNHGTFILVRACPQAIIEDGKDALQP